MAVNEVPKLVQELPRYEAPVVVDLDSVPEAEGQQPVCDFGSGFIHCNGAYYCTIG